MFDSLYLDYVEGVVNRVLHPDERNGTDQFLDDEAVSPTPRKDPYC